MLTYYQGQREKQFLAKVAYKMPDFKNISFL